ncbi:MAG: rhomboid family intramembrane serine protease [Flavobacteriales bacterium]|jgi:membrane associated rhomboid family serine protease|tara:strand:+ start:621 stop:1352 length:732 start_codon:yes stop_codon:yes gene_type:complete
MISQQRFSLMPTVVKNLLIINGLVFLGMVSIRSTFGVDITQWMGLYFPASESFNPFQLISHMFMHGNFRHILSNMIMLWFLGSAMENHWGSQRFLIYYILTGLGASALQIGVNGYEYYTILTQVSADNAQLVLSEGADLIQRNYNYSNPSMGALNRLLNTPMVGASGAVFGVLLAFGMTFPNQVIYLNFFFPIKAKYFVIGYGLFELYNGFSVSNSGVAHFAHLGGMLFGYILIRRWKKSRYL